MIDSSQSCDEDRRGWTFVESRRTVQADKRNPTDHPFRAEGLNAQAIKPFRDCRVSAYGLSDPEGRSNPQFEWYRECNLHPSQSLCFGTGFFIICKREEGRRYDQSEHHIRTHGGGAANSRDAQYHESECRADGGENRHFRAPVPGIRGRQYGPSLYLHAQVRRSFRR